MTEFLTGLIAQKRENPGDDLLTALIAVSEDADRLAENELIAMVFLLLVAGHETTVNLIANGTLALLRNPDQLAVLRADQERVVDVVEETLRYEGPVRQATLRYTVEPITVGEVEIPVGELVLVALGAANRDDARFTDPNTFDIDHDTHGHLAFGYGIHFCVGAQLARLEGQIALRALTERFPALALAVEPGELRWRHSTIMRGLETLPVRTGR
jgi:cytochrome P450